VIVALTGTDLYLALDTDPRARRSLRLADRIVVLQQRALVALSADEREKARVIVQSASPAMTPERPGEGLVACVLAHLRAVKDPLRAAEAARRLPASSSLCVVHAGAPLEPELEAVARREMRDNARYRWLGNLPRARALALLAGSDLLIVSSLAEGGANVVTEAIACTVPVISSRIDGSIGLLGNDHPGYFTPGDSDELFALLLRVEQDAAFAADLRERSRQLAPLVDPALEVERWRALLEELL
jgi:putative glycosyltransferase (TIGR04348 family)